MPVVVEPVPFERHEVCVAPATVRDVTADPSALSSAIWLGFWDAL